VTGTHGGKYLEKCDDAVALAAALARHGDTAHYISEYLPYQSSDGYFRKYRLIFVNGAILPYHLAIGSHWKMHYFSSDMAKDPRLRAEGRAPIEIRVGVNTGDVVVRSIQTGARTAEYTPIGHTTNLAARLQTIASTGSIVVSKDTERIVAGYFTLKPLGAVKMRGISEAVEVFEVAGIGPLRTRLQASAIRGLSKFVGRTREIDKLMEGFGLATRGHGQIVAAVADAGVGKSRLFYEFKAIAGANALTSRPIQSRMARLLHICR